MRTLSVQQPWAWLIVHGFKPVENRTWPTQVRGQVFIHAGKRFDREGYDVVRRLFPEIPLPTPDAFEMGGVVGAALLTDCVQHHESEFFSGPFGFVFADAHPTYFFACRGQLGFFEVDSEEIRSNREARIVPVPPHPRADAAFRAADDAAFLAGLEES